MIWPEPYDGSNREEMKRAIYDGRGVSAAAALRNIRDAETLAKVQEAAANFHDGYATASDTFNFILDLLDEEQQ